ncbi:hypothetical protein [Sphingomonas sp.]|jgi:hypothetical protein|uniref:hypothetical protein n=1 Tax=Sphingomonas sp. TaxID=28214 RepID=UPI002E3492B1|nr:hypothetical protein [Sphingomonas sp.]HEX4693342.1 hypothetical protein [Sphingomonas sp.]
MLGPVSLALAFLLQAAPPTDPCATPSACRKVDSVRVQNPDGKQVELPVNATLPWVTRDNLLLLPGDWIVIKLIDRDGDLMPQLVRAGTGGDAPKPGDGEIRIVVHAYEAGNLIMEVLSRRTETLDYAAAMVTPKGPERTSVCSLNPGVTVFESWHQPIRQLALWSFRPTTEPGCKTLDFPKKK